jgi:hypothetical protein
VCPPGRATVSTMARERTIVLLTGHNSNTCDLVCLLRTVFEQPEKVGQASFKGGSSRSVLKPLSERTCGFESHALRYSDLVFRVILISADYLHRLCQRIVDVLSSGSV